MVRRIWLHSLWAALASTGLALSQQPMPQPAAGDHTGTIITVQEMNKPAQKCVIIKTWITPEGAKAHQVQALETGEVMTIVEAGPSTSVPPYPAGTRVHSVSTRIFHWGRGSTPPPGTPMPPMMDSVEVVSMPAGTPTVVQSSLPPGTVIQTEVLPEKKGLHLWQSAHPTESPGSFKAVHSTIVSSSEPPTQMQVVDHSSAPTWTTDASGNTGTAMPGMKATPVTTPAKSGSNIVTTYPKPESAKTPVEVATPSDWRQSWGKPQTKTTEASAKNGEPAKSGDWHLFSSKPKPPAVTAKKDGKDELPKADSKLNDPLKTTTATTLPPVKDLPKQETAKTAESKETAKTGDKKEAAPVAAKPADPAALPTPAQLAGQTAAPKVPTDRLPMGAQSVLAANRDPNSQVKYLPVPIVTVPDPRRLGPPPQPKIPQPPQPTKNLQQVAGGNRPIPPNAFNEPGSEPPPPSLHASTGMTNAFTEGAPEPAAGGPGWLGKGLPGPMGMPPSMPQGMYAAAPGMPMPPNMMMASRPAGAPGTLPPTGPYSGPSPSIVNSGPRSMPGYPNGVMPAAAQIPQGYPVNPALMQAQYAMAQAPMNPAMMQQAAMARPPMPMPPASMPTASQPDMGQLFITLRDSMYPSQREWAADQLVAGQGGNSPQVMQALTTAAREDPAATVRAGCVRCLAKMRADSPVTVATLMALKNDSDVRVRREAEEALLVLAPGLASPPASAGAVQPAGATVPAKP